MEVGIWTILAGLVLVGSISGPLFHMSTIDQGNQFEGADGTDLADIDNDGCQDIVTGWEQTGKVKAYIAIKESSCTGRFVIKDVSGSSNINSVEDAHFVDLDQDSLFEVIAAREVNARVISIFWSDFLYQWQLPQDLVSSKDFTNWMQINHADLDGINGDDIVGCGKNGQGTQGKIAWFSAPSTDKRDLSNWTRHALGSTPFCMSLITEDIDNDGDIDIIVSDRQRGIIWKKNPLMEKGDVYSTWPEQIVSGSNENLGGKPMFCDYQDMDQDGLKDVICALSNQTEGSVAAWYKHPSDHNSVWIKNTIKPDQDYLLNEAKGIAVGDINKDGKMEIVISNGVSENGEYLYWLSQNGSIWNTHLLRYQEGTKYDEVQIIDMNQDGNLDILTSEENYLGVLFFQNLGNSHRKNDLTILDD